MSNQKFNPYNHAGLFYDGSWQKPVATESMAVVSPCDETVIANIAIAGPQDTKNAILSAKDGLIELRNTKALAKSQLLDNIANLLEEHTDNALYLLAKELGKPFAQSQRDWDLTIDEFRWFAAETRRLEGEIIDSNIENCQYRVTFEPVGIVAAFTAWNFPPLLAARKIAPALAAGCSVILRPSEEAPGIIMLLVECCRLAGAPKGAVNLVVGDVNNTYKVLMSDPAVRKITFTGSTNVGKQMVRDSADTLKKTTMELGGNAPTIIFDDIKDIQKVVTMAVIAKHTNAGQVCVAPDRFYVHDNIYDEFIEKYVNEIKSIKIGDCLLDKNVTMGPLVNAKRLNAVDVSIKKSIDSGALLLTGGNRIGKKGFFYTPTVLKDVADTNNCFCEENFGPITAFTSFSTEEEVIKRANQSEYGLASYLFTENKNRIKKLVSAIEAGMIGVNTFVLASSQMPFGGIKQSGHGREGGKYSIIEYCNIKVSHNCY